MSEHLEETGSLVEITSKKITLEMYTALTDLEKSVAQDQTGAMQIVDNALQTSIDNLLTEDPGSISISVANVPS